MTIAGEHLNKALASAVLASSTAFVVYGLTMARSVGWHDSAELALTAWQLGASHAPGSPIHSVLGYLMTLIFDEPHRGTSALSVISASLTAGVLASLIYQLRSNFWLAVLVATVYALSYQVWVVAVITEVYSLNMLFLSLAILFAWFWAAERQQLFFVAIVCAYAIALATYFANILLYPAFIYLIYRCSGHRVRDIFIYTLVVVVTIGAIAVGNLWLAGNALPFGEVRPDSLSNLFQYMSGSQHDPLQVGQLSFFTARIVEHVGTFSRSVLFVAIPVGVCGIFFLARLNRVYGVFLTLLGGIYAVYYTLFGPGDYFLMVLPTYFVFAVWLAFGTVGLAGYLPHAMHRSLVLLVPGLLLAGLLVLQFDGRRGMARSMAAEEFVGKAFEQLPEGAVGITGWKELTPLTYFQEVHGERTDLRFMVPARTIRHYGYGIVNDYVDTLDTVICERPVFTTKPLPDIQGRYRLEDAGTEWKRVVPDPDVWEESCEQNTEPG